MAPKPPPHSILLSTRYAQETTRTRPTRRRMELGRLWGTQSICCALGLLIYKGFALTTEKRPQCNFQRLFCSVESPAQHLQELRAHFGWLFTCPCSCYSPRCPRGLTPESPAQDTSPGQRCQSHRSTSPCKSLSPLSGQNIPPCHVKAI